MTDLEAGPDTAQVADAPVIETPASETVSSTVSDSPSTPLEDQYDFGPPGENDPPPVAPDAAPVVVDPAVAAVATPAISPELTQRAANLGYSTEFITSFKDDPIRLESAVLNSERVAMQAMQFARSQQAAPPAQAPVQQQPQLPPPPAAPVFDENAMRAKLREMNYDDSLSNVLVDEAKRTHATALQQHQFMVQRLADQDRYNAQSQEFMRNHQTQLQNIQVQHQTEMVNRDYADFVKGLPEPVQKLVTTPEAKAQIHAMANTILFGLQSTGQQLPSNAIAFKQAMYAALGDKIQGAATDTVRQEVRTHQARATTRPSSASGGSAASKLPLGGDRAGAFVEEFYRSHGMPSSNSGLEA